MKWRGILILFIIMSVSSLVYADNIVITQGGTTDFCIDSLAGIQDCFITGINAAIESLIPIITILFPIEGAVYSGTNIDLNVTANQVISAWVYSLNHGQTNVSFTPNTNINIDGTGLINVTAYGTNSLNQVGNDTVTFTFILVEEFSEVTNVYIFVFILALCFMIVGLIKDEYILKMSGGIFFVILGLEIGVNRILELDSSFATNSLAVVLAGIGMYLIIAEPLDLYLRRDR